MNAEFTEPEWAAAFANDPKSLERKIIPIRVRECQPTGLLRSIVYVDLVQLDADAARQAILEALPERLKPNAEPPFPKNEKFSESQVSSAFPTSSTSETIKHEIDPPFHNLPHSGVKEFVGRDRDFQCLYQKLENNNREVSIAAVSGMGGIGKTELALQYSKYHYQKGTYPGGVCWLRLREQDLASQLLFLAREMELKVPEDMNLEQQVRWCWRNWKPAKGKVLVVLDDVVDLGTVVPYLPSEIDSRFRILMTTRLQHFGVAVQKVQLDLLSPEKALELLQVLLDEEKMCSELEAATGLCKWLGYLPLGLELIGYYLREEDCTLTGLLAELKERQRRVLQHPALTNPEPMMTAQHGIETMFELSWERLDIDARFLGAYLSLFATAPIRWELVVQLNEVSVETYEALKAARRKLVRLSLLKKTDRLFQYHPLIQQFFAAKRESDEFVIPPRHQMTGQTSQILKLFGISE